MLGEHHKLAGSKSSHVRHFDDKSVKSYCKSCAAVSVMFLSVPWNQHTMQIILALSMPSTNWHAEQNSKCKTSFEVSTWLRDQCSGRYMEQCGSLLACTWNTGKLVAFGIVIHFNKQPPAMRQALELDVFLEDEIADADGQSATSYHVERLKRGLCMPVGYPWPRQRVRVGKRGVGKHLSKINTCSRSWQP